MLGLLILSLFPVARSGAPICAAPSGYDSLVITGTLRAGETLRAPFGTEYHFVLAPNQYGWVVEVRQRGREENLARLTPPWHFVPNPRYLEGWHFRNASNTAPNDGSVNAPQETREFFFSPEVGRSLEYEGSGTPASVVDQVRSFGRGEINLTKYRLTPVNEGERASFEEISFDVCLIWRSADGIYQAVSAVTVRHHGSRVPFTNGNHD